MRNRKLTVILAALFLIGCVLFYNYVLKNISAGTIGNIKQFNVLQPKNRILSKIDSISRNDNTIHLTDYEAFISNNILEKHDLEKDLVKYYNSFNYIIINSSPKHKYIFQYDIDEVKSSNSSIVSIIDIKLINKPENSNQNQVKSPTIDQRKSTQLFKEKLILKI